MGSKTNRSLQAKFIRSRKACAEFMFDENMKDGIRTYHAREVREIQCARALEQYQARKEQRARLLAHFL